MLETVLGKQRNPKPWGPPPEVVATGGLGVCPAQAMECLSAMPTSRLWTCARVMGTASRVPGLTFSTSRTRPIRRGMPQCPDRCRILGGSMPAAREPRASVRCGGPPAIVSPCARVAHQHDVADAERTVEALGEG